MTLSILFHFKTWIEYLQRQKWRRHTAKNRIDLLCCLMQHKDEIIIRNQVQAILIVRCICSVLGGCLERRKETQVDKHFVSLSFSWINDHLVGDQSIDWALNESDQYLIIILIVNPSEVLIPKKVFIAVTYLWDQRCAYSSHCSILSPLVCLFIGQQCVLYLIWWLQHHFSCNSIIVRLFILLPILDTYWRGAEGNKRLL